jgi:hypothetical protein
MTSIQLQNPLHRIFGKHSRLTLNKNYEKLFNYNNFDIDFLYYTKGLLSKWKPKKAKGKLRIIYMGMETFL